MTRFVGEVAALDLLQTRRQEPAMKFLILILILPLLSCAKGSASSARAEVIPSNATGVQCFAIRNDDGVIVGGNCIPQ